MPIRTTAKLRQLIARPGAIMAPGVVDALYARLVAKHGFEAMYMTGAGTSAARIGMPDVGLLTMTEMVDNAARICAISELPLIADADNGYGGPLNVRRAIQQYERAGVAAVHLEDQVLPKRCGHLSGKQLIPPQEMAAKIKAAVDARTDGDFVIIARTDALAVKGLAAAFDRAELYREMGADVLFIESPLAEHVGLINDRLNCPTLYNMATSGKTPFLKKSEIERMGYKIIIYPNWLMLAAIRAAEGVLETLKREETIASLASQVPTFQEFFNLVGMKEVQELELRYGVPEDGRAGY